MYKEWLKGGEWLRVVYPKLVLMTVMGISNTQYQKKLRVLLRILLLHDIPNQEEVDGNADCEYRYDSYLLVEADNGDIEVEQQELQEEVDGMTGKEAQSPFLRSLHPEGKIGGEQEVYDQCQCIADK